MNTEVIKPSSPRYVLLPITDEVEYLISQIRQLNPKIDRKTIRRYIVREFRDLVLKFITLSNDIRRHKNKLVTYFQEEQDKKLNFNDDLYHHCVFSDFEYTTDAVYDYRAWHDRFYTEINETNFLLPANCRTHFLIDDFFIDIVVPIWNQRFLLKTPIRVNNGVRVYYGYVFGNFFDDSLVYVAERCYFQ